ncbi:MAG TPA: ferritin-like domain-containing protein, partial [Polyangiaceae bacterium]
MTELFTLEWLGGVAEHHFRKARPEDDLPWGSLDASHYSASLLAAAREVWTGVAMSEYAAICAFSEVVGALAAARAPLDLIGMTSDFLADEVHHVELASRLLMRLGGAAPKPFDAARLTPTTAPGLTPLQRASELVVRVGCIAETFASETAVPMMRETTHPLVRAVYQTILRDEARHCRFGSLYFEWAGER